MAGGFRTQPVIQRIVEGKHFALQRRQTQLRFRAEKLLLILLLWFVPPAIETMQGAAGRSGTVGGAAMPGMRVHHDYRAGFAEHQFLSRVRRTDVGQDILRQPLQQVRPGHDTRGSIVRREVVKEPDGVANPVSLFVGDAAHVRVQWLIALRVGIRGPGIQAAEFEVGSDYRCDVFQNPRRDDHFTKEFALIDQIRQPPSARFLAKLRAGILPFDFKELFHAGAQTMQQSGAHEAFEDHIAWVHTLILNDVTTTTIVFGMLLIGLGLGGYFGTGTSSLTALIPAAFGLALAGLGVMARDAGKRKLAMHERY